MALAVITLFAIFALGTTLTKVQLGGKQPAQALARVVFWVCLPATIIVSLDRIVLEGVLWTLPLAAVLVVICLLPISWLAGRLLKIPRPAQGTVLVGTSIMNMAFFAYPVFLATMGEEAFGRAVFFDLGHGVLTFTLTYGIAVWHGSAEGALKRAIGGFLVAPPLWALLGMIVVKVSGQHVPPLLHTILTPVHLTTAPLATFVLGLSTDLTAIRQRLFLAATAVGLRMGGGLLLGIASAWLLGLTGLEQTIVVLCAAMPAGLNTVIFAAETGLDRDLAAAMVALSISVGFSALLLWQVGLFLLQ